MKSTGGQAPKPHRSKYDLALDALEVMIAAWGNRGNLEFPDRESVQSTDEALRILRRLRIFPKMPKDKKHPRRNIPGTFGPASEVRVLVKDGKEAV